MAFLMWDESVNNRAEKKRTYTINYFKSFYIFRIHAPS